MNWIALLVRNVAEVVHWLADDVHHPPQCPFADGDCDWPAGIGGFHAAHHAVSRQHRDGPHAPFAQMLLHFGDHIDRIGHFKTVGSNSQRLINRRQILLAELDVNHRTNDLHYFAYLSVRAISIGRSHISLFNSFGLMRSLTGEIWKVFFKNREDNIVFWRYPSGASYEVSTGSGSDWVKPSVNVHVGADQGPGRYCSRN